MCLIFLCFEYIMENNHLSIHMASWKESMIIWLSNLINCNRSAAKISQVLCSSWDTLVTHLFSLAPPFSPSSTSNSIQVDGNFIQTVCKLSSSLDISVCVFACPPSCYIAPEISLSFFCLIIKWDLPPCCITPGIPKSWDAPHCTGQLTNNTSSSHKK